MIPQSNTQCKMILAYLKKVGSITPLEALEYIGCLRLGARIYDLRQLGFDIITKREKRNGKSYARYYLRQGDEQSA